MNVFLDTNIFLEYFERRQQYQAVSAIFDAIEDKKIKGVVSAGCVYTLTYLLRMGLKRQGVYRPEQTQRLRTTLHTILQLVKVGAFSHKQMLEGALDTSFDDIEDSFQYHCAIQNKCDVLVTINLRDYSSVNTAKVEILSPAEFAEKYL